MGKDSGNEWLVHSEPEKSTSWELKNTSGHDGVCSETLRFVGSSDLQLIAPAADFIQTIFSPEQYTTQIIIPRPSEDWMTTSQDIKVYLHGETAGQPLYIFKIDPTNRSISFENNTTEMDPADNDQNIHNNIEDNIRLFEILSRVAENCGFPPVDHSTRLVVQNHIRTTTLLEYESLREHFVNKAARDEKTRQRIRRT